LPTPPAKTDLLDVEIRPGWRLSSERSLYLAPERTLVVADIHWGYAEAHRRAGNLLPLWGDEALAFRLRRLLDHYRPARMIWLGDSLHTREGAPLAENFLADLSRGIEVIILAGNHDRQWKRADAHEYHLGDCFFHHGDRSREVPPGRIEIMGHIHPALSWSDGAGLRLKVPALVEGPRRVILPSFSDWSSGAAWNDRLAEGERLWLVSPRKIWAAETRTAGG
jgi:metallophosphoesterase superfamily enzyme